jgi:hypothetical protein
LTYGRTILSPRFYHSIKTGLGVDRATDTIRAFVDNPQALIAVHIPPNCNADGTVVLPGMDGKPETMVDPPAATSHPLQLFLTAIKEWYGIDAGATARHVLRLPTYNVVWYNLVRNGSRLREQDGR